VRRNGQQIQLQHAAPSANSFSSSLTNLAREKEKSRFRSLESLQQSYQDKLLRRSVSPGPQRQQQSSSSNVASRDVPVALLDAYYVSLIERNRQLLRQQAELHEQIQLHELREERKRAVVEAERRSLALLPTFESSFGCRSPPPAYPTHELAFKVLQSRCRVLSFSRICVDTQ
jgi:hypothetical protein